MSDNDLDRYRRLTHQPIDYKEAALFTRMHHRHHNTPPRGWKFGIAAVYGDTIVGVAMVGRPVARMLDDGMTLEINRLTTDGTKNACSFLYGKCRRAAFSLGYARVITYIGENESGISLVAAGYRLVGKAGGGQWSRKHRIRKLSGDAQQRFLFEAFENVGDGDE